MDAITATASQIHDWTDAYSSAAAYNAIRPSTAEEAEIFYAVMGDRLTFALGEQMLRAAAMVIPYRDPGIPKRFGIKAALWVLYREAVGWEIEWFDSTMTWRFRNLGARRSRAERGANSPTL